ncbi:alpha/beta hydrolase fold domain-containing protein [Bacillus sp. 105MF]|uniref:alpha/beta hydrolase fold domain-containing protein n=1 Tax=Bacillus sp. 105MF TaxID=1151120 RepID=UPI000362C1DB|nr:alpha/beta hydrolase fold domain-containing protein [Bacillus sp. 105MF]
MRNAVYELVETNDSLPFDVSLNSVNYVPSHWHNSVEIIFVLRGTVEVRLSHEKRTLSEGDVLLINQCHVHEVIGLDRNIIATFLIPFSYLKEKIARADEISFDCYSGDKQRRHALDLVRRLLAESGELFFRLYLQSKAEITDPHVSPLLSDQLSNMPQTLIATAEFDYLKVECEAYAAKLARSGVPTKLIQYNGTDHAFMDKIGLYPQAEDLINEIAKEVKRVFA